MKSRKVEKFFVPIFIFFYLFIKIVYRVIIYYIEKIMKYLENNGNVLEAKRVKFYLLKISLRFFAKIF